MHKEAISQILQLFWNMPVKKPFHQSWRFFSRMEEKDPWSNWLM